MDLHKTSALFDFSSPMKEKSMFKWIPMAEMDTTKEKLSRLWPNVKFRIRYRGPRFDTFRLHTLKRHATHFSVYVK